MSTVYIKKKLFFSICPPTNFNKSTPHKNSTSRKVVIRIKYPFKMLLLLTDGVPLTWGNTLYWGAVSINGCVNCAEGYAV